MVEDNVRESEVLAELQLVDVEYSAEFERAADDVDVEGEQLDTAMPLVFAFDSVLKHNPIFHKSSSTISPLS